MSTITSIPNEVLSVIFGNIPKLADLAHCRLVCQRWNRLAESQMFTRQIRLTSSEQALALYEHLSKNASNGKLVRYLDFGSYCDFECWPVLPSLLQLVFTPNLKRIAGNITGNTELLEAITDIANNSSTKLDLQLLGTLNSIHPFITEAYSNALLAHRSTLRSITLASFSAEDAAIVSTITNRLSEFDQMTDFHLWGDHCTMATLKRVLKCCKKLETLEFWMWHSTETAVERRNWAKRDVEKAYSLKKLRLHVSNADLVEYITYKYPNIEEIDFYYFTEDLTTFDIVKDDIDRILRAIKHIPKKKRTQFRFKGDMMASSADIIQYFNSMDFKLKIIPTNDEFNSYLTVFLHPK